MSKYKIGATVFLSLLMIIWSLPLMAGDHSVEVQWIGPTNEVLNSDCSQIGELLTNPVSYTVQFRMVGAATWNEIETTNTTIEISGLQAMTDYEVRVGAHYVGGAVFCWTAPAVVTTPPDQPPAGCSNLTINAIK